MRAMRDMYRSLHGAASGRMRRNAGIILSQWSDSHTGLRQWGRTLAGLRQCCHNLDVSQMHSGFAAGVGCPGLPQAASPTPLAGSGSRTQPATSRDACIPPTGQPHCYRSGNRCEGCLWNTTGLNMTFNKATCLWCWSFKSSPFPKFSSIRGFLLQDDTPYFASCACAGMDRHEILRLVAIALEPDQASGDQIRQVGTRSDSWGPDQASGAQQCTM